ARQRSLKTEVFEQEISGNVVCITLNPDAEGVPLCVSGHIDTVHPVGLFGTPAVKRDKENMYGPGVMDCKGGVVAALMAMDALEKCGFKSRPVHLLLQSDEENGSATSKKETIKYICRKAQGSEAFLNLEGIKGNTAVLQRKGILRYRFTVHGKALHSSRCAEASNAVAEAAYKIIELEKMKDAEGLTCNCGLIQGGTTANTVAESCCFYADIRFVTSDELKKARQEVQRVANSTTVNGCSCDAEEISFRPAMPLSDKNIELLNRMNCIYKENGLPVLTARKCLSGSDAAYITECGIPCLDNLGTEGGNIHSVNEYIRLESLKESAKRIAVAIYCL
ncbi:MAG: M20/M25/M40 family metallo-hydrolase, partial [Clostridia bacterium]|nr:M20/M25/M40 family metallo-hydrolase [Clostridia bacterium]